MTKRITLLFEDHPDTPVSVIVSPVPMRAYFDLWTALSRPSIPMAEFAETMQRIQELAQPEPALDELDYALARAVVNAWTVAVREVPVPLPVAPSEPEPSPEPSTATPARRSRPRRNS
jgi:hypothetical protein